MSKRTWIRKIESNSTRPVIIYCPTRKEAREIAKELIGGCIVGEGRVEIWGVDPRTDAAVNADPIKTLRA